MGQSVWNCRIVEFMFPANIQKNGFMSLPNRHTPTPTHRYIENKKPKSKKKNQKIKEIIKMKLKKNKSYK